MRTRSATKVYGLVVLATVSATLGIVGGHWEAILTLPVIFWMCYSHRIYGRQIARERKRSDDLSALQIRTIEALAVAIEGKDATKTGHPHRVCVYAVEAGRRLGLSEHDLEALHAAALLRDVGILAVPEHIFSKPGKLTSVEYEKVKMHAAAGAEILEQIEFPYPVAPIVRAHHERWDGTGYPSELKGKDIPIGARILAVADCLDALVSDRHYRPAFSLQEAIAYVQSQAGKSFDPVVVDTFAGCYQELEAILSDASAESSWVPRLAHGRNESALTNTARARSPIAAARQEARQLLDLAQVLGSSLCLDETLSALALRVRRMCPFDSIAIYIRRDDYLEAEYASGEDCHFFGSLKIPMGQGLSGWVAANNTPILNGNPAAESGPNSSMRSKALHSALALPLEGPNGIVGVLSVYACAKDAFNNDHLRVLSALTTKVALSIENAQKYRLAEDSATTDALTGLPNARSLFLKLETELARAARLNQSLALLVCDLDGFKQINDKFGHLEGNRVLRAVGRALKLQCREYDYVARMGGDEFVIVLSGYHADSVAAKVEQFCNAVAEAGRETLDQSTVGMSVGVACYPDDGDDVEGLMVEADRRMYLFKQQGASAGAVRM